MSTIREVLGRADERQNVRNVAFCVFAVVLLVACSFGLVHIKYMLESEPDARAAPVGTEPRSEL